jgi:hypothetical protein
MMPGRGLIKASQGAAMVLTFCAETITLSRQMQQMTKRQGLWQKLSRPTAIDAMDGRVCRKTRSGNVPGTAAKNNAAHRMRSDDGRSKIFDFLPTSMRLPTFETRAR